MRFISATPLFFIAALVQQSTAAVVHPSSVAAVQSSSAALAESSSAAFAVPSSSAFIKVSHSTAEPSSSLGVAKPTSSASAEQLPSVELADVSSVDYFDYVEENSADLTEQAITGATPAEIKELLAAHNKYRQKHHAPALTWDTTLADRAQKWSNNCEFKHSGTPGENLGYGYPSSTALVDAWYDEVANYNYSKPGFSLKTGHFTQVVWKGTTKVGCGVQTCNNFFRGAKFYTCNYSPYGNVIGANNKYFIENVLKP